MATLGSEFQRNKHTRLRRLWVLAVGSLLVATSVAQDSVKPLSSAFFGVWKENSTFETGRSVTFERKADGIHMGTDPVGFTYDGIDRPAPMSHTTAAWKKTGTNKYEMTMKRDGKLTATSTRVISADGNVMTVVYLSAVTGASTTSVWNRDGRSSDPDLLIGTWEMDPKSTKSDERLIIEPEAQGIRVSLGALGHASPEFTAKFDGKDYALNPAKGYSTTSTVSLKQIDERTFVEYYKVSGYLVATAEYVLSADGKMLKKNFTGLNKTPLISTFDKQ
jgi:hypothetical protein